jgi:hypothetical protein
MHYTQSDCILKIDQYIPIRLSYLALVLLFTPKCLRTSMSLLFVSLQISLTKARGGESLSNLSH